MTSRTSRQRERQREITAAVTQAGSMRIEDLAERFGISLMTAHRDLDELAERGLLHKSRGLATALPTSLIESSDTFRRGRQQASKAQLARAAMAFVEPNQAVLMDDSTTTLAMAPLLVERVPLTVATNFLPILTELAGTRGITLLGLAGQYYDWANSFLGAMTIQAIERLHTDVLIMSTSSIFNGRCYPQTQETVETKRAMMAVSDQRILLVDHTKFSRRALHALCPVRDFDHVVVDSTTSQSDISALTESGATVTIAEDHA